MNAKAYILIDVADGRSEQVVKALWNKPGVVAVDYVEGPPDVIMVVRAGERQELAERVIDALVSVEYLADSVKCLPVIEGNITNVELKKL